MNLPTTMMMSKRGKQRNRTWWTRERVLLGLQRFYKDFGFTPTDQAKYMHHQQFTGRDPYGRKSNLGWHQKYPSHASIAKYFATMREAWTAAGFDVDRSFEEWTAMEDWFVLESVGILPRSEVAEILKRTGPAIKRRLYDLGDIRSYNRWGITLTHAEKLMGLPAAVLRKYLDLGIIPYLKGNKLYYLNPADLLKVDEIDWGKPVNPELDQLIRKAVAQRLAKMAKFGPAWRDHEIYKFNKTRERYTGRIKNPRKSAFAKILPPVPNDLVAGDWVTITTKVKHMMSDAARDRVGLIKAIIYSPQRNEKADGTRRSCWTARVEFPKLRQLTDTKAKRIHYSIPLDCLERAAAPVIPPAELSQHPDAIKGRARKKRGEFDRRLKRIRERVEEFRADLT